MQRKLTAAQRTPRTQQVAATVPFDKDDAEHIKLVKGLYYAWYGPKDAHEYLTAKGIEVSTGKLTQLFYNFRAAKLPRADRTVQVEYYISHVVEA